MYQNQTYFLCLMYQNQTYFEDIKGSGISREFPAERNLLFPVFSYLLLPFSSAFSSLPVLPSSFIIHHLHASSHLLAIFVWG
jgi:hypothetical protein